MKIRKESERGYLDLGWLKAFHSFSFGSFFDPEFMGFKSLRVINNDRVAPSSGFDTHPHKNMEILSFILKGSLEHKDTMGNQSIIKPGEIQLMSAGRGVFHSEFNPSSEEETELFQIWIQANQVNTEPRYKQFSYLGNLQQNKPLLVVSSEERPDVANIYQDINIYICKFDTNIEFSDINKSSSYWLQMISGKVETGPNVLSHRDGAGYEKTELAVVKSVEESEFLLFEFKE
jgi:redox-sensitive bicupin YhaK (pirin superfamily)